MAKIYTSRFIFLIITGFNSSIWSGKVQNPKMVLQKVLTCLDSLSCLATLNSQMYSQHWDIRLLLMCILQYLFSCRNLTLTFNSSILSAKIQDPKMVLQKVMTCLDSLSCLATLNSQMHSQHWDIRLLLICILQINSYFHAGTWHQHSLSSYFHAESWHWHCRMLEGFYLHCIFTAKHLHTLKHLAQGKNKASITTVWHVPFILKWSHPNTKITYDRLFHVERNMDTPRNAQEEMLAEVNLSLCILNCPV